MKMGVAEVGALLRLSGSTGRGYMVRPDMVSPNYLMGFAADAPNQRGLVFYSSCRMVDGGRSEGIGRTRKSLGMAVVNT